MFSHPTMLSLYADARYVETHTHRAAAPSRLRLPRRSASRDVQPRAHTLRPACGSSVK